MSITSIGSGATGNPLARALQEATETPASAIMDAGKDDRQAIRDLARQQNDTDARNAEQPAVNVDGSKKLLDIRA
jgi:hypothetical protein